MILDDIIKKTKTVEDVVILIGELKEAWKQHYMQGFDQSDETDHKFYCYRKFFNLYNLNLFKIFYFFLLY